jgi:capsule polysaccharide export protein KpsE/RkpR
MREPFLKALNLLLAYEQHVQHAKYDVLNFRSEGMVKMRKLAHLEGELAGIQAAIETIEAIGAGASEARVTASLLSSGVGLRG